MLQPRPHQLPAIQALIPHDRAWVMMACGTGKTLVSRHAAYTKAAPGEVIAVFSPSKRLNRQNRDAWAADTPSGIDTLLVYSDPDGTTDPNAVARFIATPGPAGRRRVIFSTYQSAFVIAQAYGLHADLPPLGVIVEDEAHTTASMVGNGYSAVLDDRYIPARARYGFTATPRVHTNPAGGTAAVASMDDQALYGPCVHELTFGKAISEHLINDFRVAVITVTDAALHRLMDQDTDPHDLPTSVLAAQVALIHAIKERGLRSVLVFHNRVERSRAFTASLRSISRKLGGPPLNAFAMDADTPPGERETMLRRLGKAAPGTAVVLSSVATIAEGVDVPEVDAVQFADPRTGQAAIAQMVGRALRRAPAKVGREQEDEDAEAAVVVLPVYLAPGRDAELILQSSRFAVVWGVLAALRDYDERLDSELAAASMKAAKTSLKTPQSVDLPPRVELAATGMDALPPGLAARLSTGLSAHLMSLGNRRSKWPPVNADLIWSLVAQWKALLASPDNERRALLLDVAREMHEAVQGNAMNSKIPQRAYTYVAAMLNLYERARQD